MNHVYRVKVWDAKTGEVTSCTWITPVARDTAEILAELKAFYVGRLV
jgi:hypothetical protein